MIMYKLIDNKGNENEYSDLTNLDNFLEQSFEYWKIGTGDSAIQIKDDERIIFFKVEEGFFIMQHPDYLISTTNQEVNANLISTHYIGGEEFKFPKDATYDVATTFKILKYYIENGTLDESFNWIDLYQVQQADIENDFPQVQVLNDLENFDTW